MSYFYAFKNRIDFAGSGLSKAKKSDIDIVINIAGEVYSAYRRVMYENSEPGLILQFCRRQIGIVFYGNLLNRDGLNCRRSFFCVATAWRRCYVASMTAYLPSIPGIIRVV